MNTYCQWQITTPQILKKEPKAKKKPSTKVLRIESKNRHISTNIEIGAKISKISALS